MLLNFFDSGLTIHHLKQQYNGILNVKPELDKDLAAGLDSCGFDGKFLYRVIYPESESYHVVETKDTLLLTLHLRALILPYPEDDESYCGTVDSSTVITLRSGIGLDANDPTDKDYMDSMSSFDPEGSIYTKCVSQPCRPNFESVSFSGEEQVAKSTASVQLKAAIPRFNNGGTDWPQTHAKQVVIKQLVGTGEMLLHTMFVVIKGE